MMTHSFLEHVNVTVRDPKATAELYRDLFGWKIRWFGKGIHDGDVYHVGDEKSYVAVYSLGGNDRSCSSRTMSPSARAAPPRRA